MRFFESTEEKSSIWEIKFEDAVKEVWQDTIKIKLTKELKILSILIEHIVRISQHTLPEYFSIDPTKSLRDILNLVFSKFGNFKTHWEYYINFYNKLFENNKISEEDKFTQPEFTSMLARKTHAIEYSLIALSTYTALFNNIIKNLSNNNDNSLITIPESLPLKFFDISQLKELVQHEENIDLLVSKGTIDIFIKWSSSPSIKHLLSSKVIKEETNKDAPQKSTSHGSFGKS